jgi:hypothetical protein
MNETGQSFFEVVVALAITALVLVAIVVPATVAIRNSSFARNKSLSTRHAQETVEWLRGQRDADWESFAMRALTPTWCLPTLDWAQASVGNCSSGNTIGDTLFSREVAFATISSVTIEVRVKIFWTDALGYKEVITSTYFTDWRVQ